MLTQLQQEILNHWQFMLTDLGLTEIPSERFVLCPTLDEVDHFKMLERQLAKLQTDAQTKLPFAVAARGQFGDLPTQRQFYVQSSFAKDVQIGSESGGQVSIVRAAPIKMLYTYVIYAATPTFLDTFIERWLLSDNRGYTSFDYYPVELAAESESLKVSLVFGDLDTILTSTDDHRERGSIFALNLPIEIETVLTTTIDGPREVILDTETGLDLVVLNRGDAFPGN